MKFLVQTINNKIMHDFSFALEESVRYRNWYYGSKEDLIVHTDSETPEYHEGFVPVGSVEFVEYYLNSYFDKEVKPINVPEELYLFAGRRLSIGNEDSYRTGECFAKSNDKIKSFAGIIGENFILPKGEYQFSDVIDIDSEWRCFVFENKLVGLQNYSGDFTKFPNLATIDQMITAYKEKAPVAYTLDIGINQLNALRLNNTFVIECHNFFSCGLYGFTNHSLLAIMFYRAWMELIK